MNTQICRFWWVYKEDQRTEYVEHEISGEFKPDRLFCFYHFTLCVILGQTYSLSMTSSAVCFSLPACDVLFDVSSEPFFFF